MMLLSLSHLLTNEKGTSVTAVNVAVAVEAALTDKPVLTTRGVPSQPVLKTVGPVAVSAITVTTLT